MSESWFYNCKNGKGVQGPFELSHLVMLLDKGELAPHHEVRCGAMGQWVNAEDLKWFYNLKDGTGVHGPVTRARLREMLEAEEINENTEVRKSWDGDWQRVLAVLELKDVAGDDFDSFVEDVDGTDFQLDVEILDDDAAEEYAADADAWFCRVSGQEQGPLPWRRVHTLASTGRLRKDDMIRHGSDPQWKQAVSFSGLFPESSDAIPAQTGGDSPEEVKTPQPQADTSAEQDATQSEPSALPPAQEPAETVNDDSKAALEAWLDDDIEQNKKQTTQSSPSKAGKRKAGGVSRMPPPGIGLRGNSEESETPDKESESTTDEPAEAKEPAPKRRFFSFGRNRTPKTEK